MRKASRRAVAQPAPDFLLRIELAAPPRQFFGADHRDIVVVALPGCVRTPAQRRLYRGLWTRRGLQHAQRKLERERLRRRIVRLAGGIAERKIREQKPRHGGAL